MRFLRPEGETLVHLGRHHATAVVRPTLVTDDPMDDITPIDTPLRLQLASELPGHQGAMVHACGYADDRGSVLFIARSGGGKTTTARKLPDAHVLSDDLVAVRRTADGWDAHALPFVGEWRRPTVPRRGRLRALVFLRKSDDLSVSVCPPSVAFPDMLQAMVWFAKGDPAAAALLDHAHDLIRAVPVRRARHPARAAGDAPDRPLARVNTATDLRFGPVALRVEGPAVHPLLDPWRAPVTADARRVVVTVAATLPTGTNPATAAVGFALAAHADRDDVTLRGDPGRPTPWLAALCEIVARDAPTHGCLLLHAGAVTVPGGVALLLAPPGVGKTTAVRGAGGRAFASNAVLVDLTGRPRPPMVWAMPFTREPAPELESARSLPLAAVAFVQRSPTRPLNGSRVRWQPFA
ncbi:MAG: hypothetical protein IPF99_28455 [Deltaproteobacteria bacterium]|nr:hypothetical protein [Deltaproteobacteria bacterium]